VKRLGDLLREAERALCAHSTGEWWDGERWHSATEAAPPQQPGESAAGYRDRVHAWVQQRRKLMQRYKAPIDVLLEDIHPAMLGTGPVNGPGRLAAARRFERRAEADRDERSASTWREIEADEIFEAVKPRRALPGQLSRSTSPTSAPGPLPQINCG
jgi:hypothetical protein